MEKQLASVKILYFQEGMKKEKEIFYLPKIPYGWEVVLVWHKAASPETPGLDVVLTALLPCEQQTETVGSPEQPPSACSGALSPSVGASVLSRSPTRTGMRYKCPGPSPW